MKANSTPPRTLWEAVRSEVRTLIATECSMNPDKPLMTPDEPLMKPLMNR